MSRYQPSLDENKFRQTVRYILELSDGDPFLGKTKLYKLLYYVDFLYFAKHRVSLTGSRYCHLPHGPVPAGTWYDDMKNDGEILVITREWDGGRQYKTTTKEPADKRCFSQEEMIHIKDVVSRFRHFNTEGIERHSHRHLGWRATVENEDIPYETIFVLHRPLSDREIEYGKTLA